MFGISWWVHLPVSELPTVPASVADFSAFLVAWSRLLPAAYFSGAGIFSFVLRLGSRSAKDPKLLVQRLWRQS